MMTLEHALAVYLYMHNAEMIGEREEQLLDTAWKIIDREARKAIETLPEQSAPRNILSLSNSDTKGAAGQRIG